MRDPKRIDPFLEKFGELWKKHPDQRFGQLFMNLTRDKNGNFMDPWGWEENAWEFKILNYDQPELTEEEMVQRAQEIVAAIFGEENK